MKLENTTLYHQLYTDIKNKILGNVYKKNSKLESVRKLSSRLKLSTTTVEKAYNQLLVEGYVKSIPRSGYIVLDVHDLQRIKYKRTIDPIREDKKTNTALTNDLFDIKQYKTMTNKVFNYYPDALYEACDPRGELELREEIRKYILKERDVTCDVDQIVVGPGIQSLLNILLSITSGKTVTYLTPEFTKAMTIFRGYNYQLKPRKTTTEIARLKADFLYISPSNTYPTGEVLRRQERNKIINWARENKSYIIEDDYNFFIRYNSYTIPSVYSIDEGRNVVYMGSFSKTILPSIRISYMVLPVSLYNVFKKEYINFSQGVSKLEQLSVALFMKEGLYQRHTKKLYNSYKEKNGLLLDEVNKYNKNKFSVRSTDSNLHIVIDFRKREFYNTFIRNLDREHLSYETINNQNSVIFPYSGINNTSMPKTIYNLFYNM
jgi:GntR family transcriptional regulator/MocR family aminotransferase